MPISNPSQAQMFSDDYPIVGEYKSDDDRVPFFNPTNSGVLYLPGEPIVIEQANAYYVYMLQGPVRPGKTGMAVRRFTGFFPCDLSATVEYGTPIYWDPSDTSGSPAGTAKLFGDVTNGFRIGFASYAYRKDSKDPVIGVGGKVICGTEDSTMIRVVSLDGAALGKGTFSGTTTTTAAPTTTTAAPTTTT